MVFVGQCFIMFLWKRELGGWVGVFNFIIWSPSHWEKFFPLLFFTASSKWLFRGTQLFTRIIRHSVPSVTTVCSVLSVNRLGKHPKIRTVHTEKGSQAVETGNKQSLLSSPIRAQPWIFCFYFRAENIRPISSHYGLELNRVPKSVS